MSAAHHTSSPFVESFENALGIGKLTNIAGNECSVSYFCPTTSNELLIQTVSRGSLSRVRLHPQTRVYYYNQETFMWEVGRVLDFQDADKLSSQNVNYESQSESLPMHNSSFNYW